MNNSDIEIDSGGTGRQLTEWFDYHGTPSPTKNGWYNGRYVLREGCFSEITRIYWRSTAFYSSPDSRRPINHLCLQWQGLADEPVSSALLRKPMVRATTTTTRVQQLVDDITLSMIKLRTELGL